MDRRVLWMVMLILGTALTVSCGDDGDDGGSAGSSGNKAGTTGGDPQKIMCDAPEVVCGLKCCGMATGSMVPPCCADEFAGECGMAVNAFGGATPACVRQVESVAGCPTLTIPVINFVLPSCCTPEKMCGLDGSVFGMGGCTELGEAAMRAMQMFTMGQMSMAGSGGSSSTDEDGGVAGAGGMSGGTAGRGGRGFMLPMFPAPQACPNSN